MMPDNFCYKDKVTCTRSVVDECSSQHYKDLSLQGLSCKFDQICCWILFKPACTTDKKRTVPHVNLKSVEFNSASLVADFARALQAQSPDLHNRLWEAWTHYMHAAMTSASHSNLSARKPDCTQEYFRCWGQFWRLMLWQFQNCWTYVKRWASMPWQARTIHKILTYIILYKSMDCSQATNLRSAYQRSQLCGTGMFQIHLDTSSTVLSIASQSLEH